MVLLAATATASPTSAATTTSKTMNRTKKGSAATKMRSLRRAELLLLEAQRDVVEQRIKQLEKFPQTGRSLKREPNGPPLPDRTAGNKRAKHEGNDDGGSMTVDEMFNQCRKLLTQLKKNSNAQPFLAPVDPVALNCPDYFKIVTVPMDFKTITAKLRPMKRIYQSPLEFRDDVRQVFKNCSLYNPIGNQIRIMGDRLSECFESLWTKSNIEKYYQRQLEALKQERNNDRGGNDVQILSSTKMRTKSPEYVLHKISAIQAKMEELMSSTSDREVSKDDEKTESMSFWNKRQLSMELDRAPVSVLTDISKLLVESSAEQKDAVMLLDDVQEDTMKGLWSVVFPEQAPSAPAPKEEKDDSESTSREEDVDKDTLTSDADAQEKTVKLEEEAGTEEVIVEENEQQHASQAGDGAMPSAASTREDANDAAKTNGCDEDVVMEDNDATTTEQKEETDSVQVIDKGKNSGTGREVKESAEFAMATNPEEEPVQEKINGTGEIAKPATESLLQSSSQ